MSCGGLASRYQHRGCGCVACWWGGKLYIINIATCILITMIATLPALKDVHNYLDNSINVSELLGHE